ncbi:MAG TPA: metalloregulator ArsR/SmtB family transcription factor [Pyrinomonadaceae bacterium]|jgi:ArsR family transcriptional regulator|nr:metalloregulator ArsR/SmtB family transcription factor [Pyrinomonadaceae bacterium]
MALPKTLNQLESLFLALADKTRLRILNLIGEDEICVGHLVEVLGESQPKVSRHLAYLRNAGLVTVRRDGKWMHYRIGEQENEIAVSMLEDLIAGLSDQEQMRKERRRMEEIGGITRKTVKPKRAAAARPQRKIEKVEDYIEPARDFLPSPEEAQEEELQPAEPRPYQRQELETFLL